MPGPGKQEVVEHDIDIVCEQITAWYNRAIEKKQSRLRDLVET